MTHDDPDSSRHGQAVSMQRGDLGMNGPDSAAEEPLKGADWLAAILESMPDAFIAIDREGRWTTVNAAAERIVHRARATSVAKTELDGLPQALGFDIEPHLRRALADRTVVEFEAHDQGRGRWLSNRLYPTPDGGVALVLRDITERKHAELNLAFLASIGQRLAHFTDPEQMMRTVGADIGAYLRLSACAFAEIDEAADQATVTRDWHRPDVPGLVGVYRISDLVTDEFLKATRAGSPFAVGNTQSDARTEPARYAALQIGAYLNVPLIRDGEWRFLLAACHSTPHAWRDDEISLLRDLTERLWTRLERLRAEAEVRASEQRYRSLLDAIDEGFYIAEVMFDADGRPIDHRILEANPAFERHTGVGNPVGKTARELVPGMEQFWNDMFGRVARSGEPVRFEHGSDAVQRWFDVFVSRVGDASSRKVAVVFNDISQRRQAALALQHRTAQFETLLNEAPFSVYLIDADFRVRSVNPAALPTFAGIENLIGRDFDEVMHILWPAERADAFVQRFRHTLATGEPIIAPDFAEVREDSGQTEYYAWQISRIAMPEGGYGVVCYFRDISGQVFARKALAQSEARWRGFFERLHEGFLVGELVHDADGKAVDWRYLEMNAGWEKITGLSREFTKGRTLREVIPEVEPEWIAEFAAVVQTGAPANFTRYVGALDRWYEVHAYRPEPGRFAAVFHEVTDRQLAQQRRLESEERLQFVMDAMPQKIFTVRPNGEIDYLNPQWAQFTGLTPEQVRDWGRPGFIHPDDLAETLRLWQHGFASGEALEIENRLQRADGQHRWHINRLRPLRDKAGQIVMWVGSSTDIHEQKHAAGELQKLAEADRRKTDFLAILAHELRNPLAPIRNALQVMRLARGDVATVEAMSGIMERQVLQMVRLVDDLLDVSRIGQGKIELRQVRVDLAAVIDQAIEACLPALQSGQHELTQTWPAEPVVLHADPARLTQVFGNLINNATKYGEAGGRIELRVAREGSEVRVSVMDRGIGIPNELLGKVSRCSSRSTKPWSAHAVAWASASRWCASWSKCTAAK